MQVVVNIKRASRRKPTIGQRVYEYPDSPMTVGEFIEKTVCQSLKEYKDRKNTADLVRLFSQTEDTGQIEERLEDMAMSGKVSYGESADDRMLGEKTAVENALQCFDDGMVALFVDGVRYTEREAQLPLKEQSEVTFVRLVFLAGRMW